MKVLLYIGLGLVVLGLVCYMVMSNYTGGGA
jgi:hypothetical protein